MERILIDGNLVVVPASVAVERTALNLSELRPFSAPAQGRIAVYVSAGNTAIIKYAPRGSPEQKRICLEAAANIALLTGLTGSGLRNHCVLMTAVYVGEDDTPYAIVYPYSGVSLQKYHIRELEPRTLYDVVVVATGAAHALAAMHWSGCIHGDVKPSNILWDERTQKAYLCDIETVSVLKTSVASDFYTSLYASPNVVRYHTKTKADDVYAFGLVLYYLLTRIFVFSKQPPARSKDTHTASYYARLARECYRPAIPQYALNLPDRGQEMLSAYLRVMYACMNRVASERPEMPTVAYVLQNLMGEAAELKRVPALLPVTEFLQLPRKRPLSSGEAVPNVDALASIKYNEPFHVRTYAALPVTRISTVPKADSPADGVRQ
jgi:serine/threonine protein kinase